MINLKITKGSVFYDSYEIEDTGDHDEMARVAIKEMFLADPECGVGTYTVIFSNDGELIDECRVVVSIDVYVEAVR